jgi:AcrR family transcriptional regulator
MHVYNWTLTDTLNKHQRKTEATRGKLLTAALRVFSRDGFERSRLEDIAAEAGHTRGAFYANFATKEDLFIALLEHQASKRVAEITRALKGNSDPETCWRAVREYYLGRARDRQWSILTLEFKLYVLRNNQHRAQFAAAHQRIREALHVELRSALQPLSGSGPKAQRYIKILLEVILNGLLLEHACDPKRISSADMSHLLGRMFDLLTAAGGDLG